jgi:hypothetical protein
LAAIPAVHYKFSPNQFVLLKLPKALPLVAFRQQEKLNRFGKKLSIAIRARAVGHKKNRNFKSRFYFFN